jgi:altronate dehydratase
MINDMDYNPEDIIDGKKSIEKAGEEVIAQVLEILSGKTTK